MKLQPFIFTVGTIVGLIVLIYFVCVPMREAIYFDESREEITEATVGVSITQVHDSTDDSHTQNPVSTESNSTDEPGTLKPNESHSSSSKHDTEPKEPPTETSSPNGPEESQSITTQALTTDRATEPIKSPDAETALGDSTVTAPVTTANPNTTTKPLPEITVPPIPIETVPKPTVYNCQSKNHRCQNEEYHIYLHNMELKGCKYCGSHSCVSFYALNEWGFTKYDASKCPKYNIKSDPAKYCKSCGREMWSQKNPTGCFSYLQDTACECGEYVKGNTCHHH